MYYLLTKPGKIKDGDPDNPQIVKIWTGQKVEELYINGTKTTDPKGLRLAVSVLLNPQFSEPVNFVWIGEGGEVSCVKNKKGKFHRTRVLITKLLGKIEKGSNPGDFELPD